MSESLYYTTHRSRIGKLLLVASHRGLHAVTLLGPDDVPSQAAGSFYPLPNELPAFFASTARAIDDYLSGVRPLNVPYHLAQGTALQRSVWIALTKIPYGETISYTALAERVGFPRAVRAVASACAANPLPLVIPCHRVIAKDGTLGGFSLGGLEIKEFLLDMERRTLQAAA